ncbi:MAG: hypothetical protein HPY45_12390 [Anaerolineae bacterium]|nr:hypothetical protein [Anaerolineae bacterium]
MKPENHNIAAWLDKPLSSILPRWNIETLLVVIVLLVAVISRFYHVDLRVMSHDEVNHVVPSFDLYKGRGYRHDPVTHGPLQFHLLALSFFMLGDSDFSARVPAVLFSIATVAVVLLAYRRYLGRSGALVAGLLFLISPFFLFYGRYTRNEAFVGLFGVLMLYAVLRHLDKGDNFSLYLLTLSTVLHFTAKETAYIYVAQMLLFLAVIFLDDISRARWKNLMARRQFLSLMLVFIVLIFVALGVAAWSADGEKSVSEVASPPVGTEAAPAAMHPVTPLQITLYISLAAASIVAAIAFVLLGRWLGWEEIREQRSFDLLMLLGTLVLPQLTAFPVKLVGWDPLDYSSVGIQRTGLFLVVLFVISFFLGMWWKPKYWLQFSRSKLSFPVSTLWLYNAALFYGVFIILYTTFFTNGAGFFTGIVGSLGYWLSQQGVQRGSQPWYYYALVQMPIYEYLAILGTLLAAYFGIRYWRFATLPGRSPAAEQEQAGNTVGISSEQGRPLPVLTLLLYWAVTSLMAFSVAGEKMPWLTVHIALGFLLSAAWGIGYLIDITPWKKIANIRGLVAVLLMPAFLASLAGVMGGLLGTQPPFQGKTLEQLQATSSFLLALVMLLGTGFGILKLLRDWSSSEIMSLLSNVFFAMMALLTIRTSYMASYVNYDYATEYMVYAHAAPGPKQVLAQVEEISRRITRGRDIVVAYDNDALYPYWWYLRNYPNHRWYTDKPTRDLRDAPLIIAGDATSGKMAPIVQDNYVRFEYMRLWWPNQDYFDLTWERIWNAVSDRQMRKAIFDIWLNRDYTAYAKLTNNQTLTPETWQPSARMVFFIRKDVAAQMWEFGAVPSVTEKVEADPYKDKIVTLQADRVIGMPGTQPGQFQAPRGVAVAPDGSIYVADSRNHRIQHFSSDGQLLHAWGSFADAAAGLEQAPGGTFNEPWGVAVAPDGAVYVSDTWNHRIQKFTADGRFISMWGYFGQAEKPEAFWGPRGLAVDSRGQVYVADTGNKRIVVFSANQEYVTQFGSAGLDFGQFDEPVAVALDQNGNAYVTDTWNQRIQVFVANEQRNVFTPLKMWDVYGWFGQSLDNKPFIAISPAGDVFVTDPEGYRVLRYDAEGNFKSGWGDFSAGLDGFGLSSGIAVDNAGGVWVSDAGNNRLMHFSVP